MYKLSNRSKSRLEGVHPDLVKVVERAIEITEKDFSITEGRRTLDRQKQLVAEGKSKTMNSRHLTGHAIDMVPYPVSWEWDDFTPIVEAFKEAGRELGVAIECGYDWGWDAPHVQLTWKEYPNA